ncbi:MAG: GNAT family N-acetyltransferase [Acidimicrobiales bacterium]
MKNLTVGRGRTVRVGTWRGKSEIAIVATFVDQPLNTSAVRAIIERLRKRGFERVITAALTASEQTAFLDCGFSRMRDLALLKRRLDTPPPRAEMRLRRWRRRRYDDILRVDSAAFDEFWRFDHTALREAMHATPHRLLRVDSTVAPTGYALSGVSRDKGYLQRLAVEPAGAGRGLGSALLLDALRWMRWRGAEEAFVNTQHDNDRALALYQRHGFDTEQSGLAILGLDLVDR